jgi:hypothetical protein
LTVGIEVASRPLSVTIDASSELCAIAVSLPPALEIHKVGNLFLRSNPIRRPLLRRTQKPVVLSSLE